MIAPLTYRRDVDGLRALAVIGVFLFHIDATWLPGGYLGVDVFFVISGFLITSILRDDLVGEGLSYRRFYERRIRRLFPPLVPVLLFTAVAASLLFPRAVMVETLQSGLATLGFVANWFFYANTGYFDLTAQQMPLLHMWSLGVEEQYYLLFPFALAVAFKLGGRRAGAMMVGASLLLSLALYVWTLGRSPELAFYGTHTRWWQLAGGAMLALVSGPRLKGGAAEGVFLAGAVGACAALVMGPHLGGEAVVALMATLATAAMILAGPGAAWGSRPLRAKPAVFIGKISYPLYLWHWPLLVFARLLDPAMGWGTLAAVVGLAFALSTLSYLYLETPIRRRRWLVAPRNLVLTWMGVSLAMAGSAFALTRLPAKADIEPVGVEAFEAERIPMVQETFKAALQNRCWVGRDEDGPKAVQTCLTFATDRPNVLILGDSHSAMMYRPLREAFPDVNFSLLAANSCHLVRDELIGARIPCHAILDHVETAPELADLDAILVAPLLVAPPHGEKLWRKFAARMEDLERRLSVPVIHVGPVPFYKPSLHELYPIHAEKSPRELKKVLDEALMDAPFEAEAYFTSAYADVKGVRYVSALDVLCPRGREDCRHFNVEGWPMTMDGSHLAPMTSDMLVQTLKDTGELAFVTRESSP